MRCQNQNASWDLPEDILHFGNSIPCDDLPRPSGRLASRGSGLAQVTSHELLCELQPMEVSEELAAGMRVLIHQIASRS